MIVNKSMLLPAGRVKRKGRRRERDDPGGSAAENGTVLALGGDLDRRRPTQYLVASKESTTKRWVPWDQRRRLGDHAFRAVSGGWAWGRGLL